MATDTTETKQSDTVTTTKDAKEQLNTSNTQDSDETDSKEQAIYNKKMINRVEVGNSYRYNRPLSFYVDRARRILRMDDTLEVTGRGNRISKACTLVEVLKRQKIAKVKSVFTGMDTQPYFGGNGRGGGDAQWSQPTTVIRFTLEKDEFAPYVSDYHQRKVIEIFENALGNGVDNGTLTKNQIEELDMANAFHANDQQKEEASKFLKSNLKNNSLDLPNFIKYASILIHPLLKDELFKKALAEHYGINTGDNKKAAENQDA